jgi:hypothetical protein
MNNNDNCTLKELLFLFKEFLEEYDNKSLSTRKIKDKINKIKELID